jgi:hypothetical protein
MPRCTAEIDTSRLEAGRVSAVSLAQTIATENEFRTALPRHAKAVFEYMTREPVLKLQRWAFARAVVRRPDLATVLFVATSGESKDLWLSVSPDGDGGWSVMPVVKGGARGSSDPGNGSDARVAGDAD